MPDFALMSSGVSGTPQGASSSSSVQTRTRADLHCTRISLSCQPSPVDYVDVGVPTIRATAGLPTTCALVAQVSRA